MKKVLLSVLFLSFLSIISCNNSKEEVLKLINQKSVLTKKQSELMTKQSEILKSDNDYFLKMSAAGASKQEIMKIEQDKKNKIAAVDKEIKDIDTQIQEIDNKIKELSE